MKIAVVTVVSGRHEHLTAQLHGLRRSSIPPSEHIVVSMGDEDITDVVRGAGSDATVIRMDTSGPRLPLASARNLGARTAMGHCADLIVFLDVDCIPGADMLARYAAAADVDCEGGGGRSLLCGPVTYLPPSPSGWSADALLAATDPHPARPNPPPNTVLVGTDYDLFWSLSFASTPSTWQVTGGFEEDYAGYGGEDTDFAATAQAADVGLLWVGGAHAYHQYHPVSSPPVERLDDIIRNSALFHRRWNRWPMTGWLDEFERRGLIERNDSGEIRRIG